MIEGVLPGAGTALMWIANQYTGRERAVDKIIAEALRAPAAQILANAGIPFESIYPSDSLHPFGWGYDLKGEQHGELMALGVIDPMKVTKSALQNAVSVAVTILSTNAIITNEA
jgi:chaperonin GroEL